MNDQRVKTNNEAAIAEFMGWERYSQNSFKCPNTYPINNNTSNGWTTFSADQLEFGSRWDWLMPVVEKIHSLGYDTAMFFDGAKVTPELRNEIRIYDVQSGSRVRVIQHESTMIKAVYNAVLEFIHWYQKQKSS